MDKTKKTIFVVDDNSTNLTATENILAERYRVVALYSAEKMFGVMERVKPDLILLDIEMPEMSGFEALRRIKSDAAHAGIPVIFLTWHNDPDNETRGLELGAVDFIMKPYSEAVLLNRIKLQLHIDELICKRTEKLAEQAKQLMRLKSGIVYTMANMVENRDKNTGGHIDRTARYTELFLDAMRASGVYASEIADWNLELVASAARLHDVGKITISDAILNKPGALTDEEFMVMQTHSEAGARIIDEAIKQTGNAEFLQSAKIIAAYHHERWNGSGYPFALKGEEIPLQGRIMAIVDVYDALVTERPYKNAFTHEKAIAIIAEESGKHFDPLLTDLFITISDKIKAAKNEKTEKTRVGDDGNRPD
jgi:putative two-component system response regulator